MVQLTTGVMYVSGNRVWFHFSRFPSPAQRTEDMLVMMGDSTNLLQSHVSRRGRRWRNSETPEASESRLAERKEERADEEKEALYRQAQAQDDVGPTVAL